MRSNGASRPERWLPGTTAVGPSARRAVLQVDVRADREHGIRDAVVPRDAFAAWDVRAGVAVPGAAREIGRVAPRGVGDDVTVLTEQRLDDLEDPRVPHALLTRRAAVEQLVAELLLVLADAFGGHGGEDRRRSSSRRSATSAGSKTAGKHRPAVALELRGAGRGVTLVHTEVLEEAPDHDPTLRRSDLPLSGPPAAGGVRRSSSGGRLARGLRAGAGGRGGGRAMRTPTAPITSEIRGVEEQRPVHVAEHERPLQHDALVQRRDADDRLEARRDTATAGRTWPRRGTAGRSRG